MFAAGQLRDLDGRGHEGDVAGDRSAAGRVAGGVVDGDEGARQAAPLVGQRMLGQPAVQRHLSAGEPLDVVLLAQRLEAHGLRPMAL